MKRTITSLLVLLVCAFAYAQRTSLMIDNQTPGWLSSRINYGDQKTIKSLVVTGYIDDSDLQFIGTMISNHQLHDYVDLTDANYTSSTTFDVSKIRIAGDGKLNKFLTPLNIDDCVSNNDATDTLVTGSKRYHVIKGDQYGDFHVGYAKCLILREGVDSIIGYIRGGIEDVIMPSTLKYIGNYTFSVCNRLKNVNLPDSVEYIGDFSFSTSRGHALENLQIDSLYLPKNLKTYYYNAIREAKALFFPEGVNYENSGKDYSINYFPGFIKELHFKDKIPTFGYNSKPFRYADQIVYVPKGCAEAYRTYAEKYVRIIEEIPVTAVILNGEDMHVGEKKKINGYVTPSDATNSKIIWNSSNPNVLSIDEEGNALALSAGESRVTIKSVDGGYTASAIVNVYDKTTGIQISQTDCKLYLGEQIVLSAQTLPLNTSDNKIEWSSSNSEVATVDEQGNVFAKNQGKCMVKAKSLDGDFIATCNVAVLQHVTNVRLSTHSHNMNTGEEFQLQCTVTPANADNKDVIWSSSNDEIASVDQSGKVKALKRGQVKIVATSKDDISISDICELNITQLATAIELDKHEARLAIGNNVALNVKVSPQDVNTDRVTWKSSDNGVARVSDDGIVTAVGKGTAKITATTSDGSYLSDVCEITIWQPVTSVSLEKHECLMKVGETTTLRTSILPNEADNKNLVWTSSNEKVATVENGVVTAHASGKARISVATTDGSELSDDCEVTVSQPVIGINVDPRTLTLKSIGATKQLTANVLPENADNRNVKWSSANTSVCLVMDNGMVVAVGEGSSVITATTVDGGFTDFCVVNVDLAKDDKRPVTGIKLEQNSVTLSKIGETIKLKATVLPEDADNPNVQWESSDRKVCLVMNDGTVVAVGEGSSIVTATTVDGDFSAQCVVVVKSAPSAITETSSDVIVVRAENHYICVEGMSKDDKLQIFSIDGTNIYRGTANRVYVEAGVYLVKIGNEIVKLVVK